MNVVSINPWQLFDDLHNERSRFLASRLNRETNQGNSKPSLVTTRKLSGNQDHEKRWQPNIDILESESHYLVSVDLPGVTPKAVDIQVEDNILTVQGNRVDGSDHDREINGQNENSQENTIKSKHSEKTYGEFYRSFQLPENINQNSISAKFDLGVLNITIGKQEKPQPKKIKINES